MTSLDRAAEASSSPEPGSREPGWALRSLSSATLAVCSASAFLVLVTLLSFVPDGGPSAGGSPIAPDDVAQGGAAGPAARQRAADAASGWSLRGPLPPSDAPPLPERVAQRAPS